MAKTQYKWLWRALICAATTVAVVVASAVYLLATSPYAHYSIVRPPFTTTYTNGKVVVTTHYTPRVYRGWAATAVGYYKQAVTIVWDRLESPKLPAGSVSAIEAGIYRLRFDPTKPYVMSGDQFDDLYLRNLSVFYQDMLDRRTAVSDTDWHNRQRLAVQSLAYGLAAMQQLRRPVTTLSPVSPQGVAAFDVYHYPSDTMFGVLGLMQRLDSDVATRTATTQLTARYHDGLVASYRDYLNTVRDPKSGLVRGDVRLSSARDAASRQSSFYDNVILWKTEQLATQLGLDHVSTAQLDALRAKIVARYWDAGQGHFIDDAAAGNQHSYSSDWLIALPTGFLDPSRPADLDKMTRSWQYIQAQKLATPLPIRYTVAGASGMHENVFVKLFAGAYGNTATWSYWGDLYIGLETDLYQATGKAQYATHAQTDINNWQAVMVRDHGYPETLDAQGKLFETLFYESIRRNGWVVDFEAAKADFAAAKR